MYYLKTTISIYINLCNMHSVHVFTYMYQIPFDSTFTIKEPRVQTKTLLKLALATPSDPWVFRPRKDHWSSPQRQRQVNQSMSPVVDDPKRRKFIAFSI